MSEGDRLDIGASDTAFIEPQDWTVCFPQFQLSAFRFHPFLHGLARDLAMGSSYRRTQMARRVIMLVRHNVYVA